MFIFLVSGVLSTIQITTNVGDARGDDLCSVVAGQFSDPAQLTQLTLVSGSVKGTDFACLATYSSIQSFKISEVDVESKTLPDNTFLNIKSLKTISLGPIEIIGDSCFKGTSIDTIETASNLLKILDNAFSETCLPTISLDEVTTLGPRAFEKIVSLTTVKLPKLSELGGMSFFGCTELVTIEIPLITHLPSTVFYGCSKMVQFKHPGITWIEQNAFEDCYILETVELLNVEAIDANSFKDCYKLVNFIAPKVTKLDYPFVECRSLKILDLPEAVKMDGGALEGCISLETVLLPKLQRMKYRFFYSLSNLKTINLDSVEKIEGEVFYNCSSIEEINLPSVLSIHTILMEDVDNVFSHCTSLKVLKLPKLINLSQDMKDFMTNTPLLTQIYLPSTPPKVFPANSFENKNCELILPNQQDYKVYDDNVDIEGDAAGDGLWCGLQCSGPSTSSSSEIFSSSEISSSEIKTTTNPTTAKKPGLSKNMIIGLAAGCGALVVVIIIIIVIVVIKKKKRSALISKVNELNGQLL